MNYIIVIKEIFFFCTSVVLFVSQCWLWIRCCRDLIILCFTRGKKKKDYLKMDFWSALGERSRVVYTNAINK